MRLCAEAPLRERLAQAARERIMEDFDNRRTIEPLMRLFQKFVFKEGAEGSATAAAEPMTDNGRPMKKALIIVHDVPGRGGSRFAKFVRHLPRFGYEPIVLTIRAGQHDADGAAPPHAGEGFRLYRTWCLYKSPFRVFSKLFTPGP